MSLDLLPHYYFSLGDGGQLRYAQFAASMNPKGTILVLPGAREFIEKKYIECGRRLVSQGFRVIIVEPRGQGLSSRMLDGEMRQRTHIDDFDTYIDDLRAFCREIVFPRLTGPLILHGHSLGGHIVLRWLADDRPEEVSGAFVTSPMLAFSGMVAHLAGYGAHLTGMRMFGGETVYAPLQHDFGGDDYLFENNPLTQDEDRFRLLERYFEAQPELITGGVTWGWLLEALGSMQAMQTWPYLSKIEVPVLSLMGDRDIVTPPGEVAPFLNMIPNVRTRILFGARHDLLNEVDLIRAESWREIDAFLKARCDENRRADLRFA